MPPGLWCGIAVYEAQASKEVKVLGQEIEFGEIRIPNYFCSKLKQT